MEKEPYKVSLLVPVYGVEEFIERCSISLFEQTYQNLEFVFVNDNTKDNSVSIIKECMSKYPNRIPQVKIVEHQKNRGLAAARNTAVEVSTGDFLIHVDSDDWVDKYLVQKCVEAQLLNDVDIVSVGYTVYEKSSSYMRYPDNVSNTREMLRKLFQGEIEQHIWGRLIRTKLYKEHQIKENEGLDFAEDVFGMTLILFFAQNHCVVNNSLYNYERRNLSSYSNTFSPKNSRQSLGNAEAARTFFQLHDESFLDDVWRMELGKVSGHMMLCCKNRGNKDYYNTVLLKKLASIDKKYQRQLPLKNRIVIILYYFDFVRLFMWIGGFVKRLAR